MSSSFEILELGSDGSFEIPSPTRTKVLIEDSDDEAECKEDKFSPVAVQTESFNHAFKDLIADMLPGDFRVLESANTRSLTIAVMLDENEKVEHCMIRGNLIEILTGNKKNYSVEVPDNIQPQGATSSSFGSFIYVQVKKLTE